MEAPNKMWTVQSRYPLVRRILFPVYGLDQLAFFAAAGVLVATTAIFDYKLALYLGVGGYFGAMLVMEVTTPSALLLPADYEQPVVQIFDEAPFLKRSGDGNEWVNARGRLYRWDSDTLRITHVPDGLLVTGGYRDLDILLAELKH